MLALPLALLAFFGGAVLVVIATERLLELPQSEVGGVVYWAVDLLLTCFPLIASIVRAEGLPDIAAVAAWWENLMRTSALPAQPPGAAST
jgi:hypothetical protein